MFTLGSRCDSPCAFRTDRRRGQRAGRRAEKIRSRRNRHGNQDRQHHAVQRAGLGLWHHRQDDERLHADDQRHRRRQRPQDQFHQLRRRLQPAEDGGAGAQAGRERRGVPDLRAARHRQQRGDPEIHEHHEGAAAVRGDRRLALGRSASTSRGPSAGSRTTAPRRGSMRPTSCSTTRMPRSACCTRTTISERTTCSG